ncbi:hypothetical protein LINGRAHAP2_LOCUS25722 [Linum grandiflorum]
MENPTAGEMKEVKLKPIEATPESFKDYGQVIGPSPDGEEFGPQDAQLNLTEGTPRFYIMKLTNRPLKFAAITHHAKVTQCLGSIGGAAWFLGVAKSSIVSAAEEQGVKKKISKSGHTYLAPEIDDVRVFRFSGSTFVKLEKGTWHAGPLFEGDSMDFYNLELSNTNVVDHTTHYFNKENGVVFAIDQSD